MHHWLKRPHACISGYFLRAMALVFVGTITGCQQLRGGAPTRTLTVAAAASLQDVISTIDVAFDVKYPGLQVNYNFAASGVLQRQIENGAPIDIFFAASSQQMDALQKKMQLLPGTRQNLLTNTLVLVTPTSHEGNLSRFEQLIKPDVKKVAVGAFQSVPAGQYAAESLTNLGLLKALQPKFAFSNSVRSVLAAVESGNVDAGLVYQTDANRSQRVNIAAVAPANSHTAIIYPIAIIKTTSQPQVAKTYINFLSSSQAQSIFTAFGFGLPKHQTTPDQPDSIK